MTETEIRLRCLELAAAYERTPDEVLRNAVYFSDYVLHDISPFSTEGEDAGGDAGGYGTADIKAGDVVFRYHVAPFDEA